MKKKNTNKPTNKDILAEISYLGQRLMSLGIVVDNLAKIFDLYISFKKDKKKFEKFLKDQAEKMREIEEKEAK